MGRKAETHSLHKLHSDTEPYNWEEPLVSSFALRKRVWATYQAVSSQGFHMKDESLTHPAPRAEGACIRATGPQQIKKQLNWHKSTSLIYSPWVQHRGNIQKLPFPSFNLEGVWLHSFSATAEGSGFNQPAQESWPRFS